MKTGECFNFSLIFIYLLSKILGVGQGRAMKNEMLDRQEEIGYSTVRCPVLRHAYYDRRKD